MVGGVIIGLSRASDGKTHVHVASCPHYPKHGRGNECPRPDTCCVYTNERRLDDGGQVTIKIGDSFWWQGGRCYWTPAENRRKTDGKCGTDYDIPLAKLGYSH